MQRKRESDWNCVDSITFEILHFNWVRARCTSKMKYRSGHHKKKGEDDPSQYKYNTSTIQSIQKKTQRKETYHNQWDEVEFVPRAAHCVIRLERETCFHQNQTTFPLSPLARPRYQCFCFVFSSVLIKVLFLFPFSFFCYILNGLNMCVTQHKSSIQGNLI